MTAEANNQPRAKAPYVQIDVDEPILGKPDPTGWSCFELGPFHGSLSYVDDVPDILLDAMACYQEHGTCSMNFDEEGSEFHVFVTPFTTFVVHEREEAELYAFDVNANHVVDRILTDIENDVDGWSRFNVLYEPDDEEYDVEFRKNKARIGTKLRNIHETIEKRQHRVVHPERK